MGDETKKKEEKKDPVNIAGGIADLLGLAGTAAAQIPSLRKPKKSTASADAARAAASKVASAVVSGAQTRLGQHGGHSFMQGLREGAKVAPAAAYAQAQAADIDRQRHEARVDARNTKLAQFGKDVGGMVASTTGELAMQTQARKEAKAAGEFEYPDFSMPGQQSPTGLSAMGAPQQGSFALDAPQEMASPEQQAAESIALQQANQQQPSAPGVHDTRALYDPTLAYLGLPQQQDLWMISPELENQLRLQGFASDEARRLGIPETSVYARVSRMQNLPAVRAWSQGGMPGQEEGF